MSHPVKDTTLGVRLRALDFEAFRLAETRYAPGASLEPHTHEFTYLSLVLRGGFEESVGRNAEQAQSASVVVMPAGVTHQERIGHSGARSLTVVLTPAWMSAILPGRQRLHQWRWFHGGPVARIMLRAYRECLLGDPGADLGLSELLLETVQVIDGASSWNVGSARRSVAAALDLLHARATSGLRLDDLAANVGTDPAYLARAFRRQVGCTMSEYRRRLWVRRAAHLLASSNSPLGQLALDAGFADQSHLCRVFKAELGLSPRAYRILTGPR